MQGGVLVSVFGYMIYLQPLMALLAFLVFSPQMVFVPLIQRAINRRVAKRIMTLREVSMSMIADPAGVGVLGRDQEERIGRVFHLNMGVFKLKFSMNFLMNLLHHVGTAAVLGVGGWFVVSGQTEVGTVVAFVSGLAKINDPWGDLVNWFRDLTVTGTKYRLISSAIQMLSDANSGLSPLSPSGDIVERTNAPARLPLRVGRTFATSAPCFISTKSRTGSARGRFSTRRPSLSRPAPGRLRRPQRYRQDNALPHDPRARPRPRAARS